MNSLPDSVPYSIKVSFFMNQRREWEKVLESSKSSLSEENRLDMQHWVSVNKYALEKIEEIDRQLEELKNGFGARSAAPSTANVQIIQE